MLLLLRPRADSLEPLLRRVPFLARWALHAL